MFCPRECNNKMSTVITHYEERKCYVCGWVDNSFETPRLAERNEKMRSLDNYIDRNRKPGRPKGRIRGKDNLRIIELHRAGATYSQICEQLDLSPMRVDAIIKELAV